ncbi:MAG TPA: hypothetical protein GXZ86_09255 [Clostridiales bacterium]|jgi:hypothetical protein|nr:hypothetical protein [Clostridiales bacterium]
MKNNRIKQALNNTLSSLYVSDSEARMLLAQAKEGKRVKRKLPVALVLAVLMVLMAATAVAIVFGWTRGAHFLEKEQAGKFAYWTEQEQIELVESLVTDGYISADDRVRQMRDTSSSSEERAGIVKSILLNWLAAPTEEYIAFCPIMERIWGTFGDWSVEQKAWFSNTLIEAGVQQPDFELYVFPTENDIPEEQAKRIAMAHLCEWFDIQLKDLQQDHVYTSFVIFPLPRLAEGRTQYTTEGQKAQWHFEFGIDDRSAVPSYLTVNVEPITGYVDVYQFVQRMQQEKYMRHWPDIALQAENFMKTENYRPFMEWSLEARAMWSQEMAPVIRQHDETELDNYLLAISRFEYGLPQTNMLNQEQATKAAVLAIEKAFQFTEQELEMYDLRYLYFDVTDPAQSKWRLHMSASGIQADTLTKGHPEKLTNYVVEIDPITGETLNMSCYVRCDYSGFEAILKQL